MPPRKRQESLDPKLLDYIRSEQRKWAGVGVEVEPAEKPSQAARIDGLRLSAIELAESAVKRAKNSSDPKDMDIAFKAMASAIALFKPERPTDESGRTTIVIEMPPDGDQSDDESAGPSDTRTAQPPTGAGLPQIH